VKLLDNFFAGGRCFCWPSASSRSGDGGSETKLRRRGVGCCEAAAPCSPHAGDRAEAGPSVSRSAPTRGPITGSADRAATAVPAYRGSGARRAEPPLLLVCSRARRHGAPQARQQHRHGAARAHAAAGEPTLLSRGGTASRRCGAWRPDMAGAATLPPGHVATGALQHRHCGRTAPGRTTAGCVAAGTAMATGLGA
jgi:hypothetical protein